MVGALWLAALCAPLGLASPAMASGGITTTALTGSTNRAVAGQVVTYTARINPRPDGGAVAFTADGSAIPGCGAINVSTATGSATCQTAIDVPGPEAVEANYSGDAAFAASRSQTLPEVVSSSLRLERVRSTSAGREIVKLRCAIGSGGCSATGTLSARGARPRAILLGIETAKIPAGKTRDLTIKLGRAGQGLLARRHRLVITLEIMLTVDRARSVAGTRRLLATAPNPILAISGAEIVRYAKQFMRVPYVFGGNGPTTFDCSGFTSYVYAHFGYQLKRQAYYQMQQGRPITGPLQPGDLIFWDNGGHVGIYTGHRTFISATVHRGVWIYGFHIWSQTQSYATARRILGRPTAGGPATVANWLPRNGGRADATP